MTQSNKNKDASKPTDSGESHSQSVLQRVAGLFVRFKNFIHRPASKPNKPSQKNVGMEYLEDRTPFG